MGLQVEIYRSTTTVDCTNGGMSSRQGVRGFTLTNVEGPSQPSPIYPAAKLKKGAFNSLYIKPAWNEDEHTYDGGNFAASSDSRFSHACRELLGHHFYGAVSIHDRVEYY